MSRILYRFQKSGNDYFIDYLKGISIILVVLSHTLPHESSFFPIWGGSKAVPIFLVIQIFHAYKKGEPRIPSLKKIFNRVILPFLFIQCVLLSILIMKTINNGCDILQIIKSTIASGGNGPGSYYIYIYIQFALILPFIYKYINKYKTSTIFAYCLIISILLEMIASFINLPDYIYRLLATRYFFLIYFGFKWAREGLVIGLKEIILGLIGFLSVLYFRYFYRPLEPVFFDTNWYTDRWICFFYVMYIYVPLLFILRKFLFDKLNNMIQLLGKCSYEIFLLQMFICATFKPHIVYQYVDSDIISSTLYVLIVLIMSICGGLCYYQIRNKKSNYS